MIEFSHPLGPDLELRPAQVAHTAAVFAAVDTHRAALAPWLPWVDEVTEPVHTATFLRDAMRLWSEMQAFYVTLWSDDAFVGMASLDPVSLAQSTASLGWWVVPPARGRGFATRAAHCLLDEAFARWNLQLVEARMSPRNEASRAVAERIGLVTDEHIMHSPPAPAELAYTMTRDEWAARPGYERTDQ